MNDYLSLAAPPRTYTMLFDPRGKIHATTGILPTKIIDIPPDQFKTALSRIEVSFLSTPILTENRPPDPVEKQPGELDLPVPLEPGYTWSWTEAEPGGDWNNDRKIKPVNSQAHHVGKQIIREGWLVLRPDGQSKKKKDPERKAGD
ncbi:MAG: hypothetical protein R3264_03565 [Anaerolineae bacterium]|nr:hypothetical protein [Anaerolineae bacterium]